MRVISCLLALLAAPAAHAHTGGHTVDGWLAGFVHPFLGLDHLLAMTGVGLWAVRTAPRRAWLLPVVFVMVMTAGGALGAAGLPLAGTETGLAASVVLLGVLTAAMARLPDVIAALLVGLFALLHGHAHGAEMAAGFSFATYALGFAAATALLHLLGIGLGRLMLPFPAFYRGVGGMMGIGGALLLAGM
jgi:urease accessory protein